MSASLLERLLNGETLGREEARGLLEQLMDGEIGPEQAAAILACLRLRGETCEELVGFAEVMRQRCSPVDASVDGVLIDTCGTGGDASGSFNVSTATAFVAAGMGLYVAKHGNRSVSSRCGSADVLEELGVNIGLAPRAVATCIEECGIGFLYAPLLHPAMKQIAPLRRALGVRTCFNMLGPLCNPARATRQLIGCFSREAARRMAGVLAEFDGVEALIVTGRDGLDEISVSATTDVLKVSPGKVAEFELAPADFGLRERAPGEIRGGSAAENAGIIRSLLEGEPGAARDIVLANAAACAVLGGMSSSFGEGAELAAASIDSGAALARLERLAVLSQALEVHA